MSEAPLKVTVLGSGTSMGVPTLGCRCRVCTSKNPHDNRLRPSLLLSRNGQNVVIDTTPDFRQQALRAGIDRLDAVLLTHGHADHILGFDDIRPYNLRQRAAISVYGNEETFQILRRAFAYVFDDKPTLSTVPSVTLRLVSEPFELLGIPLVPVPVKHGDMAVLGFRFGGGAYLTDFSSVPESSLALLQGLDHLVIDALRDIPHPMHQTVDQALALIQRLNPRHAWFTHIAHDLAHAETNERLRKLGFPNVQLAYDGLMFEVSAEGSTRKVQAAPVLASRPTRLSTFPSSAGWAARYADPACRTVLAIGNFDGIHLGHQAILRAVVERARKGNAMASVLTFDPLPPKVLRPESAPPRLITNEQRIECFAALGLEAAIVMPFTHDLARLSAQEFVDQILVRDLRVRTILVGEDFRFGHKQCGDVPLLRQLGQERGFDVATISPVAYRGETVSSTVIRREIAAGNVTHAGRLLGRPFVLTGKVVTGTGTGRRFTFPTLNLASEQELLPARGVYITRTLLDGETWSHRSVTNIGVRPTFNGTALSIETHILTADERTSEDAGLSDQVGPQEARKPGTTFTSPNRIEVRFWKRLREEKKFSGPEVLRAQIARDIATANRFFSRLRLFRSKTFQRAVAGS